MPDPRIDRIEAELSAIRRKLLATNTPAVVGQPPQVRLGIVIAHEACTGHTEPAVASVQFRFVDPVFAGQTWAERQSHHAHAYYVAGWINGASGGSGLPFFTGQIITVVQANGYWWIVAPEAVVEFELKDTLAPGSNATAYLRINGTTDTDFEFEVYDVLGQYYGRAKAAYSAPHAAGSIGAARYNAASAQWDIIDLTPHALMITGEAAAAVAAADAHFHITVATTEVMSPTGGIIIDQDPAVSGGIAIENLFGWKLDSGARIVAAWRQDGATYKWVAIQAECPA